MVPDIGNKVGLFLDFSQIDQRGSVSEFKLGSSKKSGLILVCYMLGQPGKLGGED